MMEDPQLSINCDVVDIDSGSYSFNCTDTSACNWMGNQLNVHDFEANNCF